VASKVYSTTVVGLDARVIEVEVDAGYGLRRFEIVGLGDRAVQESKERVASALKSISIKPQKDLPQKILVNLAPADLKKEGSLYDLPIAIGYLLESKQIRFFPEGKFFIGELSLDGKLRPVKGVLSFAILAKEMGWREIILPKANAAEASLVSRQDSCLKIIGVETLKEAIDYLENRKEISSYKINLKDFTQKPDYPVEIDWIKGQEHAKRALEISAAGSHHLMMVGPPGAGKTLLAKSLISILPSLDFEESLEVTKIYSIAGLLKKEYPLMLLRPFRSPHHTSSEPALIGGGNPPRAGEITLAHKGILFLDEWPEFHRDVLESLRQPIEEGEITILRAKHYLTLPARFTLVAAANPCPCGYLNDPEKPCRCSTNQIRKYQRKLSGPLIDRIDIFIDVPQIKYEKLASKDSQGTGQEIKKRVANARAVQKQRFGGEHFSVNGEISLPQIKKYCPVDLKTQNLLRQYVDSGRLTARGYHRILKVARTIADLENSENISYGHIAEALMYRFRENE